MKGEDMSYLDFDFPHTRFFESDLRELIKQVFIMNDLVTNFVSINAIKYADPIQWDITKSYEKNTVVIDGNSGVAYISVKPVPPGISLTREQYWTKVFDLSMFITKGAANFANAYEAEPTTTATQTTQEGNWVVWDGTLYQALTNIHPGDRYVPGGNIRKMTVEDFYAILKSIIDNEVHEREAGDDALEVALNEETEIRGEADNALHTEIVHESVDRENADNTLQDNIDAEAIARENADNTLQNNINAEAAARENADNTLQDNIDAEATARENADVLINNKIGELSDLNTDNKDNIVSAINDALSRARIYGTKAELINDTDTHNINEIVYVEEVDCYYKIVTEQSQITLALNNKYAELLPDNKGFYHIDGVTTAINQDILPIINYLFSNNHTYIYIGKGSFALSDTITVNRASTPIIKFHGAGKYNTVVNCARGFIYVNIDGAGFRGSEFKGFTASGVATAAVGGSYNGFEFVSKNNSPEDMYDNVTFDAVLIKYFNCAIRISIRCIWNLWTNVDMIYNVYGFVYSKGTVDSFFNCNTFINCRIAENKARCVSIYGYTGQAVSNNFVGCSIEGSYYTNESSSGNLVDFDILNAGVVLTGCHFEKFNVMPNATAICAVNSNLCLTECFFYAYRNHVYVNSGSLIIFNQPSLYGETSLTAFGTDTGTTIKNNPFTF